MENKGSTYNSDLDVVGKHLWPAEWSGVCPSDKYQPRQTKPYAIINVDKSNEPGSHWMAICDGLVYDSFGRKTSSLVDIEHLADTDPDAEQDAAEENCGQRCLAWIWVYDKLGREAAKLI
jgi:hypothetical protein